ncbi:hypothetical protein AB1Y20_016405 [Prymnesium parvum]|uniref:RGS domain-containing protein n=1 Tax=Prymnesium parvum TaxID=97485 RepID=A0AB34ICS5_PRYPA
MGCGASQNPAYPSVDPRPQPASSEQPPLPSAPAKLDFERVLSIPDNEGFERLKAFASAEHSQENVLFLKAVSEFRAIAAGDTLSDAAAAAAAAIIDDFLWRRAKSKVNLPGEDLEAFVDRADHGKYCYSRTMFDAAYDKIHKLVEDDTFRRFLDTAPARELAARNPSLLLEPQEAMPTPPAKRALIDSEGGTALGCHGAASAHDAPLIVVSWR